MNKFHVYSVAYWLSLAESLSTGMSWAATKSPGNPILGVNVQHVMGILAPLSEMCRVHHDENGTPLSRTTDAISSIETKLKIHGEGMVIAMLQSEMQHLVRAILLDLKDYQFIPIGKDAAQDLENEKLFGEAVFLRFKDARDEIIDGGNCLALELSTAAVFHFMRVAEYGLHELANELKVTLVDHGEDQPIELATWDKIINSGIAPKIAAAHQMAKDHEREKQLQFYSDTAEHCKWLKDLWRNPISHGKRYNQGEALGVKTRVRDFMQVLARGL